MTEFEKRLLDLMEARNKKDWLDWLIVGALVVGIGLIVYGEFIAAS